MIMIAVNKRKKPTEIISSSYNKIVLKDVRAQKFPRTDFFKTLTVGRK